jgi:Lon protease-like protein
MAELEKKPKDEEQQPLEEEVKDLAVEQAEPASDDTDGGQSRLADRMMRPQRLCRRICCRLRTLMSSQRMTTLRRLMTTRPTRRLTRLVAKEGDELLAVQDADVNKGRW